MPVPLGKASGSKAIQHLTAVLAAKQQELEELQQQHDVLCYQHKLLVSLCDSLHWLRTRSHEKVQGDPHVLAAAAAAGELASTKELGLLQQLQGVSYSMHFARLPTAADVQQPWQGGTPDDQQPIAPPDDMLQLFHKLALLPPLQNTGSMGLAELQADYMASVRELSLNLYLHKAGRTAAGSNFGSPSPLERIAAVLTRHLHLLFSVSLAQRGDLVSAFLLSNCETGEIHSAVNREQHRSVVPHLNLSQQQLASISAGIPVFKRLLAPVVQELKLLQQEELGGGLHNGGSSSSSVADAPYGNAASNAAPEAAGNTDVRGSAEADAGAAAAAPAAVGEGVSVKVEVDAAPAGNVQQAAAAAAAAGEPDVAESFTHFKALGLQQRRARRLEILLQKEYLIRSYASTYVYGCLSWVQLATLSVLMTPFSPAPAVLVQEIFNAMEEQRKQQEQQQQQQQQQAAQQASEQQQQQAAGERRPRSRNSKQHAAAQQQQHANPLHESGSLYSSEEHLQQQQDAAHGQALAPGHSGSVESMEL